ncbi:MAG TPA: ATP-binding cassette domain-containing protein [Azospirillum sp.]
MARILLDDVSVHIPVYDAEQISIRTRIMSAATGGRLFRQSRRVMMVEALTGVSLDLRAGARVGLIGHNGSGKTTLLRVLAGIIEPTVGVTAIEGRSQALLNLDFGINEDLSGYRNIENLCLLFGLDYVGMRACIAEIADFTELGDFLAMPVRTYSSGMRLRLAFAVVTSLRPEILLLDELVGVGDTEFMTKATRRLRQQAEQAHILVLASHSEMVMREYCTEGVILEQGRILAHGPLDDVLRWNRRRDRQPCGSAAAGEAEILRSA